MPRDGLEPLQVLIPFDRADPMVARLVECLFPGWANAAFSYRLTEHGLLITKIPVNASSERI
jgi:hypothetical protein